MAEEYKARVGARIREARLAKKGADGKPLSQAGLARLMPGKTDGPSISRWERGEVMPGTENLEALGTALEKDVSYFLVSEPLPGTPDLMGTLANGTQLDRMEALLEDLSRQVSALLLERELRDVAQHKKQQGHSSGVKKPGQARGGRAR